MMKTTYPRLLLAGSLAACMLTSCATVKVDSWTDPEFKGRPVGKTMVLGVADSDGARRRFEDLFAQRLDAIGVEAVTSYSLMPQESQLTEEDLEQAIKGIPADSLILTKITDRKDRVDYMPPMNYGGYGGYYGYYGHSFSYMHSPGYVQNYTEVYLEMNLYDLATRKLAWAGQTKVTDYQSDKKNMELVVEGIIKDLQKQGMMPTSK